MADYSSFQSTSTWLTESLSPLAASTNSTTYSSPLGSLKTERLLLPNHESERARALAYCARIDHIKIRDTVKINGNTHYAIQIFYKKTYSNIPTNVLSRVPQGIEIASSPDLVTHHRFSKFGSLRHEMYFHAHNGHGKHPCSFCGSMVSLLSNGPTVPRISLKLFHGNESVSHALEGFMNSVLSLTQELFQTANHRGKLCEGQREIPLLLEQFLKPLESAECSVPSQTRDVRRSRKLTPVCDL